MSDFHRHADESEGRRGSTIDSEGGRYLGIPLIRVIRRATTSVQHHPGVHGIGGAVVFHPVWPDGKIY